MRISAISIITQYCASPMDHVSSAKFDTLTQSFYLSSCEITVRSRCQLNEGWVSNGISLGNDSLTSNFDDLRSNGGLRLVYVSKHNDRVRAWRWLALVPKKHPLSNPYSLVVLFSNTVLQSGTKTFKMVYQRRSYDPKFPAKK